MSSKYKKICFLCGKEYQYCSSCKDFRTQPTWKNMFHSENCYKIFSLSTQFAQGSYSAEEARLMLDKYDLSDIDNFKPDAIEQIKIIQNSKPTVIEENVDKKGETKVETKVETKSKKNDVEAKDVLPEATTFKKKKKSMKRTSDKSIQ